MSRVRVHCFTISLDGFGTGTPQTLEQPFGHAGQRLHPWMVRTAHGAAMFGAGQGQYGIANDMVERSFVGIGATIMGRNMFGPSADLGKTNRGRAGGDQIHRIITRHL